MSGRETTIVAGVSELSADDLSLRAALEMGRRSGATVHLVHAFALQPMVWPAPGAEVAYATQWGQLPGELKAVLEGVARPLAGEVRFVCHVVAGSAEHAIADVAARHAPGLVVVGAAHARRIRPAFLGSTARSVLRMVHAPVLVVRAPLSDAPPRVLLTTDLSPLGAEVHERGLDTIARFVGAACEAMRLLVVVELGFYSPPVRVTSLARAWMGELEEFLRARRPRPGPGPVELAVRTGTAPVEIVAASREWRADLLVVGTHARHGIDRLILGSTAETCVREAPCNVLVIPPPRTPVGSQPWEAAAAAPSGAELVASVAGPGAAPGMAPSAEAAEKAAAPA